MGSGRLSRSLRNCADGTTAWPATRCGISSPASPPSDGWSLAMNRPYGMLAELTYKCPLHCPYCSNPLNLADYREELTTADWQRVLTEARDLGVLQLHLSGGEPLQRRDLEELVATARDLGLYTNLITSSLGLSPRRAEGLKAAGLDHVQISIQADELDLSDRIAGTPSYETKVAAARMVKGMDWPLTLNVVLHRHNIGRVGRMLDLAEELGADRIELANTQYYGWAWRNRKALLPSRAQLDQAEAEVRAAHPRTSKGHRARALAGLDLGGVAPLPTLPGNGVDAGPVQELRSTRDRFRRLPLPGVSAHRRCRAHRSGLPPLARPSARGRDGPGRQRGRGAR